MSIKRLDGTEVLPTTCRPKCPNCSKIQRKGEVVVLLRVRKTVATDHPQIFMREYVCPKCGHIEESEYVYPLRETDYFLDEEIARAEEVKKARSQRAKENLKDYWRRSDGDD